MFEYLLRFQCCSSGHMGAVSHGVLMVLLLCVFLPKISFGCQFQAKRPSDAMSINSSYVNKVHPLPNNEYHYSMFTWNWL